MMYVCNVMLSEEEYVYIWFRWAKELERVKKMEEEMRRRMRK